MRRRGRFSMCLRSVILVLAVHVAAVASAGGILPDRINQLIVGGRFDEAQPQFLVVFSARPLTDSAGKPMTTATAEELGRLKTDRDRVVLKLFGKPVSKSGRLDYFFGTQADADQPWNDGRQFRWQEWENHSADAWDHLSIAAVPGTEGRVAEISDVTLRRGGKLLYDSRATKSYPNERPIRVGLPAFSLRPMRGRFPVLNLSEEMGKFRTEYYELGNSPILQLAYADLGQTEKRKYANRGQNWCSEFASYVYRESGLKTPDPNKGDVHFRNMAEAFRTKGHVYPMREVARWSDTEKRARIKPGSFVSILIGDSTHSLIFTTWVHPDRGGKIMRYAAVSGNNKGMVWSHDPLPLPTEESLTGKSPKELAEFDERVYFAVPEE